MKDEDKNEDYRLLKMLKAVKKKVLSEYQKTGDWGKLEKNIFWGFHDIKKDIFKEAIQEAVSSKALKKKM